MLFVLIVLSGAIFIVVLIMSSSQTESIFGKVKEWAHCTMEKVPSKEKMQMARVAEAGKLLMQKKAQELVLEVGGGPMLQSYASDGTPVQYKHKHVAQISKSFKKVRTYGGSAELLVQTCYYRAHNLVDGKSKDVVVVQDPLPLTNGKTALALFAARLKDTKTLR